MLTLTYDPENCQPFVPHGTQIMRQMLDDQRLLIVELTQGSNLHNPIIQHAGVYALHNDGGKTHWELAYEIPPVAMEVVAGSMLKERTA